MKIVTLSGLIIRKAQNWRVFETMMLGIIF
jgi:hypothetical protein